MSDSGGDDGGGKGVSNGDGSAPGQYQSSDAGPAAPEMSYSAPDAAPAPGGGAFDNLPSLSQGDSSLWSGGTPAPAAPAGGADYSSPALGFTDSSPGGTPGVWDGSSGIPGFSSAPLDLGGMYSTSTPGIVDSGGTASGTSAGGALPGNTDLSTLTDLGATKSMASGTGASGVAGLPGVGDDKKAAAGKSGSASGGGGSEADSIMKSLGIKNPLGTALALGGMGYSAATNSGPRPSTQTIEQQAAMLNDNGKSLMTYMQKGDLPPGLKASLEQATSSAKAKVIQNYANSGMSTDPNKNSALAQQLASIDQQALISTAQIGQQLMDTGLKSSGMASDLYKTLSSIDQTQTERIGKSIAAMSSALNGGGSGLTLKVG